MNETIKSKLIEMADHDQHVLNELAEKGEFALSPKDFYHPKLREIHESNAKELQIIINEHGWPGLKLVGNHGAEAAWLIAQHAVSDISFMKQCAALSPRLSRE